MTRRRGAARGLVLALLLGLGGVVAFLLLARGGASPARGHAVVRGPDGAGAELVAPGSAPRLDGEAAEAGRVRDAATAAGKTADAVVPRVDPPPGTRVAVHVTGRVVDPQGRGLAGAWLGEEPGEILATSDDAGLFDARVELGAKRWFGVGLEIGAPGHASVVRSVPAAEEAYVRLGTVVLEPGLVARGKVTLASGAPAADVEVQHVPSPFSPETRIEEVLNDVELVPVARTSADGSFRLAGLPRRDLTLLVDAGGGRVGAVGVAGAGREEVTGLELRLAPRKGPPPIEGVVLGPDGNPVPDALVQSSSGGAWFTPPTPPVRAGEDGRFVFHPERQETQRLEARPPPGLEARPARASAEPGARGVELRLLPAARIEVAVTDAQGVALPWSTVDLGGVRYPLGERGRASLPAPVTSFGFLAWAPGYGPGEAGPFEPDDVLRAGEPLVIALAPSGRLLGRVVRRGGPVPGARIELGQAVGGTWSVSRDVTRLDAPFLFRSTFHLDPHDAESDVDGRFVLSVHRDGSYPLLVRAEGLPPAVLGPFELTEHGTAELELELEPGGALAGRVLVPEGESASGRIVGACPGWGVLWTTPVTEEGTYRLEGLPPGEYQVRECLPPVAAFQGLGMTTGVREVAEIAVDAVVRSGETTAFDLDLRDVGSVVLEGSVRPLTRDAWALLLPWSEASPRDPLDDRDSAAALAFATLEEDGSFRLEVSEPGRHELFVCDGGQSTLVADLHLIRGTNTWGFAFEPGSLRIVSDDPEALRGRNAYAQWEDPARGLRWRRRLWPSRGAGREWLLAVEGLPPGVHHLVFAREVRRRLAALGYAGGEKEPEPEDVELDVEVIAGRQTVVELVKSEGD